MSKFVNYVVPIPGADPVHTGSIHPIFKHSKSEKYIRYIKLFKMKCGVIVKPVPQGIRYKKIMPSGRINQDVKNSYMRFNF